VRQRSPAKGHRTEHYATSAPWGSNRNSHKRIYTAFAHLLSIASIASIASPTSLLR